MAISTSQGVRPLRRVASRHERSKAVEDDGGKAVVKSYQYGGKSVVDSDIIDISGNVPTTKPTSLQIGKEGIFQYEPIEINTVKDATTGAAAAVSSSAALSTPATKSKAVTGTDAQWAQAEATRGIEEQMRENSQQATNARMSAAGAGLFLDIMNANSKYEAVKGEAGLNIYLAQQSANDAIARGKTRANMRVSEGMQQGEQALVYLAAQGLDVNSVGADRIAASQEAMGLYNGMMEEINSHREAMGYELEEVQLNYMVRQAEVERDTAVLGGIINFGANALVAF